MGARRRGEAKARTAERLIDEGLLMEDHPGIVFRDGPAGRRAALASGPDIWEVIETLKGTGLTGEQAIAATAEWGTLTHEQIRTTAPFSSTPVVTRAATRERSGAWSPPSRSCWANNPAQPPPAYATGYEAPPRDARGWGAAASVGPAAATCSAARSRLGERLYLCLFAGP
jgi:hypothetical protein